VLATLLLWLMIGLRHMDDDPGAPAGITPAMVAMLAVVVIGLAGAYAAFWHRRTGRAILAAAAALWLAGGAVIVATWLP